MAVRVARAVDVAFGFERATQPEIDLTGVRDRYGRTPPQHADRPRAVLGEAHQYAGELGPRRACVVDIDEIEAGLGQPRLHGTHPTDRVTEEDPVPVVDVRAQRHGVDLAGARL